MLRLPIFGSFPPTCLPSLPPSLGPHHDPTEDEPPLLLGLGGVDKVHVGGARIDLRGDGGERREISEDWVVTNDLYACVPGSKNHPYATQSHCLHLHPDQSAGRRKGEGAPAPARPPLTCTLTDLRHLHPDESNEDDDDGEDARPVAQVVAEDLKELSGNNRRGEKNMVGYRLL